MRVVRGGAGLKYNGNPTLLARSIAEPALGSAEDNRRLPLHGWHIANRSLSLPLSSIDRSDRANSGPATTAAVPRRYFRRIFPLPPLVGRSVHPSPGYSWQYQWSARAPPPPRLRGLHTSNIRTDVCVAGGLGCKVGRRGGGQCASEQYIISMQYIC